MNPLDIDRLHRLALGDLGGRGSGRTELQIQYLIGVLEVAEEPIAIGFVGRSFREWKTHFCPRLVKRLEERGFRPEVLYQGVRIGKSLIRYMDKDDPEKLRGFDHMVENHFCPSLTLR